MSKTNTKTKGTANEIDKHVGLQIRSRRTLLGLSQEKLAEAVGVTFQQIQKYERGTNRVSASRLFNFSKALDVSLEYFYQGLEAANNGSKKYGVSDNDQQAFGVSEQSESQIPENLLQDKEVIDLIRAYFMITDPKKRKEILRFIKSMS